MIPRRQPPGAPRRAALGGLLLAGLLAAPIAAAPALAAPPAQIEGVETLVRGENIRLRLGPGDEAEEVAILQDGEPVTVSGPGTEANGHVWWPILVTATGEAGWVRWEFLVSGTPVLAAAPPVAPPADAAAADADAAAADDGGGNRNRNRNRNRDNAETTEPAADAAATDAAAAAEAAAAAATGTFPFQASGDAGTTNAGPFPSPGGRLVYTATHDGDGPFVVTVIDADGTESTLIEAEGAFDDQVRLRTPEGTTALRVEASGPWTLDVQSPDAAADAAADPAADPAADAPADGETPAALPFQASGEAGIIDAGEFASPGGRLTYVATHEGDGPFTVSLVDADEAEEIVIEANGAYDDQVRFRTAEGVFSILVEASGPWTIEVQPPA